MYIADRVLSVGDNNREIRQDQLNRME
jgi:hypothetical protein